MFIYSSYAQEHEDNCFRRTAQHFHGILDSCMRLVRYICFYIVLHGNTTESNSKKKNSKYVLKVCSIQST